MAFRHHHGGWHLLVAACAAVWLVGWLCCKWAVLTCWYLCKWSVMGPVWLARWAVDRYASTPTSVVDPPPVVIPAPGARPMARR